MVGESRLQKVSTAIWTPFCCTISQSKRMQLWHSRLNEVCSIYIKCNQEKQISDMVETEEWHQNLEKTAEKQLLAMTLSNNPLWSHLGVGEFSLQSLRLGASTTPLPPACCWGLGHVASPHHSCQNPELPLPAPSKTVAVCWSAASTGLRPPFHWSFKPKLQSQLFLRSMKKKKKSSFWSPRLIYKSYTYRSFNFDFSYFQP